MTVLRAIFAVLFSTLFLLSCQDNGESSNWQSYYIHKRVFKNPSVLEYTTQIGGLKSKDFILLEFENDTLKSYILREDLVLTQKIVELFSTIDSKIISYQIYENNELINCELSSTSCFPFEPIDDRSYLRYEISWESKKDSSLNNVSKARMFLKGESELKSDTLSLIFETAEYISNEKEGTWSQDVKGKEWYGKGIGLYKKQKYLDNGEVLSVELTGTYNKTAFETEHNISLP